MRAPFFLRENWLDQSEDHDYHDYTIACGQAYESVSATRAERAEVWLRRPGDEPLLVYSYEHGSEGPTSWQHPELEELERWLGAALLPLQPTVRGRNSSLAERSSA